MLKQSIQKKLKQAGFSVRKVQEAFLEAVREAMEDLHGTHWQQGDLPALFRNLEREVRVPLCDDPDGPQLSKDIFKKYMSAARKSLLTGVPFTLAYQVSYEDLPKVKAKIDADERNIDVQTKCKEAIAELRNEKRQLAQPVPLQKPDGVYIPTPNLDDPEAWIIDLIDELDDVLSSAACISLRKEYPVLRKLSAVLAEYAMEGEAVA